MSLFFKPKKTYIKKFSAGSRLNYSKKIKFSKSASGFKLTKSALSGTKPISKNSQVIRAENTIKPYVAPKQNISGEQVEKIRSSILANKDNTKKTTAYVAPKANSVVKTKPQPAAKIKKNETKVKKQVKIPFKSILKYTGCTLAVCVLLVAFVALAEYGIRFIEKSNLMSNREKLEQELLVQYAPEDYVYPVPNDEARKKADDYRLEHKTPDYTPPEGEVPGIYVSDYVKNCYLTFDDGPSPVTEQVLDVLDKYGIKATFFVVGKQVYAYPDLLVRMYEGGHSIGNHSYSHDYSSVYRGDDDFNDEVITTKRAINYALKGVYENYIFRFPGGSYDDYKQGYKYNIKALGYEYIDWNSLTGDGEIVEPDADKLMQELKEYTNDGTKEDIVVLMHDAGAKQLTADILPDVIDYLKLKGYNFKAIWNSKYDANSKN